MEEALSDMAGYPSEVRAFRDMDDAMNWLEGTDQAEGQA